MQRLTLNPSKRLPPTRDNATHPTSLPKAQETKLNPHTPGGENASIFFVGTATTILEWEGIRLMTDPNFLHAGDHVHLGPGVTAKRLTDPALDLEDLPPIDVVLLSHYHEDHFDKKVEDSLRRSLPIITTPHARECLVDKKEASEAFTSVYAVDTFDNIILDIDDGIQRDEHAPIPAFRVVAMPGEHVPPGILKNMNDFLGAVPPTNGWMLELGSTSPSEGPGSFTSTYRIYISGDTLLVSSLHEIPKLYKDKSIDLMLIHLGGTTIPGPSMPLLMVTMDAEQGVKLMQLINPNLTIPVHFDDYDVFLSPLEEFRKKVEEAGWSERVVYLDRKDEYRFKV